MRVFKTSYKDKTGQKRQAAKWYVELRDHLQIVRRFPAFTDKRQSEALGRRIEKLVNFKIAGQQPDTDLSRWLESVPTRLRNRLVSIGLLDTERAAAGKLLSTHLEDFQNYLRDKGNIIRHAGKTYKRAKRIINGCKFDTWTDLKASKVQRYLASLREGEKGISAQTFNYYLQSIKQFCRWMVNDRRASENPLSHLKPINAKVDQRRVRRAMTVDEIRNLIETTKIAPERYGMTGPERAML